MKSIKSIYLFGLLAGFSCVVFPNAIMAASPVDYSGPLVVTATNPAAANQLLVFDKEGNLLQTLPTEGKGGVSGNAGGIATMNGLLAVVNYGSQNVSIFEPGPRGGLKMSGQVPAASSPVSVAFGYNHLYILGTTKVESHPIYGSWVADAADGVVNLLKADGSSAQVGVVTNQLVITEKSNVIETVNMVPGGAISGTPTLAAQIPANVNAPFGLVTRGDDAYVTIAHANEISLVRFGSVLTTTGSGTQMAPCWLALTGPFLYSANSPSQTVSRYAVYGQKLIQDAAVAATFNGNPTDIAAMHGLIAVVDANATVSHLSIFTTDDDGNMTLVKANALALGANGAVIVP